MIKTAKFLFGVDGLSVFQGGEMDNAERITRIKRVLELNEDKELAEFVRTQHPRVARWKKQGFHATTAILIDALLDKIEDLEKQCKLTKK
jgi:hypothetical protein